MTARPVLYQNGISVSSSGFPLICCGAGANQRAIAGECVTDHREGCNDDIRPVGSGHSPFAACRVVRYAVAGFELCHFVKLSTVHWSKHVISDQASIKLGQITPRLFVVPFLISCDNCVSSSGKLIAMPIVRDSFHTIIICQSPCCVVGSFPPVTACHPSGFAVLPFAMVAWTPRYPFVIGAMLDPEPGSNLWIVSEWNICFIIRLCPQSIRCRSGCGSLCRRV